MAEDIHTLEQVAAITEYVDIEAPPSMATAYLLFGTNQIAPIDLVVDRYNSGLAPVIVATGGVNRHNGVIEGQNFRRRLIECGVDESAIRYEDRSANTWQNVEFALPYLRQAVKAGFTVTAVTKWYHRRAIHCLRTLLPEIEVIYAATYEPIYSDVPITRANWFSHPDGRHRVIREWRETTRRVADGSYKDLNRVCGAWR